MAGYNEVLEGGTKTIKEWASKISSSKFFNDVIPGKAGFAQELSASISSNQKVKATFIQEGLAGRIENIAEVAFPKLGVAADKVDTVTKEIVDTLKGTDYSREAVDTIAKVMEKNNIDINSEAGSKTFGTFKDMLAKGLQEVIDEANVTVDPVDVSLRRFRERPLTYMSTYLNNPDKKVKHNRIAAIAGTYAGVAVGARYLSGGSITRDEYGQRDIAGIPFI